MSKKMLIAGACVMALLILASCQADKKSADEKPTESTTSSFSASSEDTAKTEEASKDDTEEVINEMNSEGTEIVEKVAEVEEKCGNVSDDVEKEQTDNQKSTGSTQSQRSGSTGQFENSGQSLSQSVSKKSTKQTATSQNTEKETPQPTTESPKDTEAPKPTEQPKPSIDIDGQISFAKEYATSIGLTLDSTATDCWDNPITVNVGKADVKGDIKSRLNRYKNTEGFTSVWVWVVKISDTEYELYIGYA